MFADYILVLYYRLPRLVKEEDALDEEALRRDVREYNILIKLLLFIPTVDELTQVWQQGPYHYVTHWTSFVDIATLVTSYWQLEWALRKGPYDIISRLLLVVTITLNTVQTFLLLRVIPAMAPLVAMLRRALWDMRHFLFILFIMIVIFAMVLSILGFANRHVPGGFRD